jgi:hypothetical protein
MQLLLCALRPAMVLGHLQLALVVDTDALPPTPRHVELRLGEPALLEELLVLATKVAAVPT